MRPRLVDVDPHLVLSFVAAFVATAVVYLTIPGLGLILFGETGRGLLALGGAAGCCVFVYQLVHRIGWERVTR